MKQTQIERAGLLQLADAGLHRSHTRFTVRETAKSSKSYLVPAEPLATRLLYKTLLLWQMAPQLSQWAGMTVRTRQVCKAGMLCCRRSACVQHHDEQLRLLNTHVSEACEQDCAAGVHNTGLQKCAGPR